MSMEPINFDEAKQSQLPAAELLINLDWQYLSCKQALALRGDDDSRVILGDVLRRSLMRINNYEHAGQTHKFKEGDIARVVSELESIRVEGVIDTSRAVTDIIMPKLGGSTIEVFHDGKHENKKPALF